MANTRGICYWCGKPATTREHVPPRCFFPSKDKEDKSDLVFHWENLLTVPSCDEHNNKKSGNDEYLLAHTAPARNTNGFGIYKTAYKVLRSVQRNKKLIEYIDSDNPDESMGLFRPVRCDDVRLCTSIEAIARALVFHKYGIPFKGRCYVYFPYDKNNSNTSQRNENALQVIEKESEQWKSKVEGTHPEVFKYHFSGFDQYGCASFIITFYNNVKVAVVMCDDEHIKQRQILQQEIDVKSVYSLGIRPEFYLLGEQGYNGYKYDTDHEDKLEN